MTSAMSTARDENSNRRQRREEHDDKAIMDKASLGVRHRSRFQHDV
eukprot:CAMPEP_0169281698 /NCGR_PEP_ID=MMETSP1016-20121227/56425_1 /TAXON_ID=342587 /ORGANISM="Karlodinium micrum, Strain CCMP2283" /LENGTH=45 /DNA_ID= /DNA_START= /DNA_END= /DNA_ORIENTATION=